MLDPVTKGYLTACPAAAAHSLLRLENRDLKEILEEMPTNLAADVLEHMPSPSASRCLLTLSNITICDILEDMHVPSSVAVLRHMKHDQVKALLARLPRSVSIRLRMGLRFSETVVGSYIDAHVITLKPEHHVSDAFRLYRQEGRRQAGYTIYVLDDQRRLVGEVHLNDLLGSRDRTLISRIMRTPADVLNAKVALHSVANNAAWLTNDCLPVVNRNNVFQGVLWRERVMDKDQELINKVTEHTELVSTRSALADIFWMIVGALVTGGKEAAAAEQTKVKER